MVRAWKFFHIITPSVLCVFRVYSECRKSQEQLQKVTLMRLNGDCDCQRWPGSPLKPVGRIYPIPVLNRPLTLTRSCKQNKLRSSWQTWGCFQHSAAAPSCTLTLCHRSYKHPFPVICQGHWVKRTRKKGLKTIRETLKIIIPFHRKAHLLSLFVSLFAVATHALYFGFAPGAMRHRRISSRYAGPLRHEDTGWYRRYRPVQEMLPPLLIASIISIAFQDPVLPNAEEVSGQLQVSPICRTLGPLSTKDQPLTSPHWWRFEPSPSPEYERMTWAKYGQWGCSL